MASRKRVLDGITRSRLLDIARNFDLTGLTSLPKDDIAGALAAKRSIAIETILELLGREELKAICESLGLDSTGREKSLLIERITEDNPLKRTKETDGHAGPRSQKLEVRFQKEERMTGTKEKKVADKQNGGKEAEAYDHKEATVSLRPEIGTQAQFKKKKPPRVYKYDPSLSPTLEWDGKNPAREQGEALIREIIETDDIAKAKEAAAMLRALSKPFLNWAGKAERLSFDVPTLPLFVHERLSTKAIIETLKSHKKKTDAEAVSMLDDLFGDPHHSIADQVLKAYEYQDKWTNRMILGDSLVVMNSLLHYENLGGQVQMIYMDPPYGVKFGSNFQPFVRKRDVKNSDDDSMTREPEMVKAYRDTWELGLHSYLTYMRDRLLVARELLKDTGSIFVQISDENVHHVREVMDEVFGAENFIAAIAFQKTGGQNPLHIASIYDTLIWYAKDKSQFKTQPIFAFQSAPDINDPNYIHLELEDGSIRPMTPEERKREKGFPAGSKIFRYGPITSAGASKTDQKFEFDGEIFEPPANSHWKTSVTGMALLSKMGRVLRSGKGLAYKLLWDDFPAERLTNIWVDTQSGGFNDPQIYSVQTTTKVISRCILMATKPGDLVIDPTCGSGTTALVAEHWGRRFITIDVSRVPLALARQRLLTATYPYFSLQDSNRGPASGFIYKRKQTRKGKENGGIIPHIKLENLANNEEVKEEILFDKPEKDESIVRITGPFAFEATIPTPVDYEGDGIGDSGADMQDRGSFIDRMLEVLRQSPVIQLGGNKTLALKNIRLPAKTLSLSAEALVPAVDIATTISLSDIGDLHAEKTGGRLGLSDKPLAIVFGPESGAVSEKLVYEAAKEAAAKNYAHLLVIGFAIQPNARQLIDTADMTMGIPATYIQMTPDLMMGDLLKNMRSSQIFSVCGLPEIKVKKAKSNGGYQVELLGLDVFDPSTMVHHPLQGNEVPAWFLDTDYNGLCFHVCQAFFPRTGAWESLKKALRGNYEDSVWDHLAGTESEPFEAGEHKTIAVKVIDDRGNELLVTRGL